MMTFVTNILGAVLIGMIAQAALVFISMPPNFLLFMKTGAVSYTHLKLRYRPAFHRIWDKDAHQEEKGYPPREVETDAHSRHRKLDVSKRQTLCCRDTFRIFR